MNNNSAKKIVFDAISLVNEDSAAIIDLSLPTDSIELLGDSSSIDSLTLVRLLISIEQLIEERTGDPISIVDEATFSSTETPFANVSTLISHVKTLLNE